MTLALVNIGVLIFLVGRKTASSAAAPQPVPAQSAPEAVSQPRPSGNFSGSYGISRLADDENSIGAQAGKAVGQLEQQAGESYGALSEQTRRTMEELQKTSDETTKVLNEQAAKTAAELRVAYENILKNVNREIEKFNQTLEKSRTS